MLADLYCRITAIGVAAKKVISLSSGYGRWPAIIAGDSHRRSI
jgi:hypothetical protein